MKRLFLRRLVTATALLSFAAPVAAQTSREILPVPTPPFEGKIAESISDSKPVPLHSVKAPEGAPNVLFFMSDDTGFAMSSAFGGPVATPNMDRLAKQGQRYNRFHSTGICSPSRAALLTGRNHHNAGNGFLSDLPAGYPGYRGIMSPETATIAQTLRLNGYNTAMFGKDHNVPTDQRSAAGPFDNWPTGRGFEYFFGFVNGDTDQFQPSLYRGTSRVHPNAADTRKDGELLDKWLADDIIDWVHNQKAAAPNKPFFLYLSPGSTHAPHQAPVEYIARFKGKFDQGWDKVREQTHRRQLAEGIIPKGTKLTPRPEGIPAWASLDAQEKAFAARTMEVAAAQLVYQDEQLGRVIDELKRIGQFDNTLMAIVQGDNGASGEGGPKGTINELRSMRDHNESSEWLAANIDQLGGPMTYQNYPVGWAWAMNTPLRWTKQFASMLGGVRNGMILSWPGHVAKPGSICAEFSHLIDLAPTALDAANLPVPKVVLGTPQKPMDGQSLLPSLQNCQAEKPRTQYFEIGGKVGLYHNGWFLSGDDGRVAWEASSPATSAPEINWTLYDLSKDFSQATDVSAQNSKQMQAMMQIWKQEAERNNVYPLDHRRANERGAELFREMMASERKHHDIWGKNVSLPANAPLRLIGRSFTLNAEMVLEKSGASGVIMALGSRFGGLSLYLDEGRPSFVFARSTDPDEIYQVRAENALPQGKVNLRMRFATDGPGRKADIILSSDDTVYARLEIPNNLLQPAGNGETLDFGQDIGVPVTQYLTPYGRLEGELPHVAIDFD